MPLPAPMFRALLPAALLLGVAGLAACGPGDGEPAPPLKPAARGDADAGLRLLTQYQCGSCHVIPGVSAARGINGPTLQAFGKRSYIAGRVPNFPDALASWIVAPTALVPDTRMPSMGVSPDEARHMAAYLGQLE
ncbi:MAG: c-type cytochrome [Polaromonas sp.]|nr:c-type cytochrome [Polaromonas sp.]